MAKDGEKTIGKGLELLELVGRSRNGLRGKEIAETLGLPVSTVFRQLKFLAERGFLRNADGVYTLGGALIRLGNAAMRQNPLSRLAHPLLAALSEATCETVHLAELRGGSVVYIDKVEGSPAGPHGVDDRQYRSALLHRGRQGDPRVSAEAERREAAG